MRQIKEVLALFIIQLVITIPIFTANVYGLKISDVKATKITQTSATIEWKTDNASKGKINYGKTIELGLARSHNELLTEHSLTLINGILQNATYFFSIEAEDKDGNITIDNNSNKFYTFKIPETIIQEPLNKTTASKPVNESPPQISNISIPRYINRRTIDIKGNTKPFAKVSLFVNNMNSARKTLSSNEIGSSGRFAFVQVQLDQNNMIKIVAEDQFGKAEKSFEVSVDTEEPIVKLANITSLTSKPNITISGNVNEPVVVKVFVDSITNQSVVPDKIKNLNATKVSQNSVELKWDESKDRDFSHYVVYRDDTAIATTTPANYNLFVDPLVDSNKQYKYQVSVVNIFGKEGIKSDVLTVKTLTGGATLNLKHEPVDIFEDFRKPAMTLNASGSFNFGIRLNSDGLHKIKLVFEDKAGNKVTFENNVQLDTKKPNVKIISPPSGSFVFENMANNVDIIGQTKPNARVHLFIDRTPLKSFTNSSQTGLTPEERTVIDTQFNIDVTQIENLTEEQLESKCKLNVGIKSSCSQGADKSVTADTQGNFKFENVDLTASFGLDMRLREVPVTQFRDTLLNQDRTTKRTTLVVIATDKVGQRGLAIANIGIGTCWSGNQSWDIIPLTQYQSPTFLSTERMAEGTETLYFYFNYSYIGRGANAKIESISLQKACSTNEIIDPRFNVSCKVLPAGDTPTKLNPDGTLTYSAITLNRFQGMDRFLEADWKSFMKAINNELSFPFKVRITYKHDVIDDNGQLRTMTETQTTCQQLSYVLDNTLIDPRKVLPDFLLNGFVDFLDKSIRALTKVQEQIDKVIDYVAIGCLYSFLAHLVMKIYRNIVELSSEKVFVLKEVLFRTAFKTGNSQNDAECPQLADAIVQAYTLGSIKNLKLKYFSDPDLKKCFPAVYNAWQKETRIYELQRWSCDRIFGHTSPSRWTETKKDAELNEQITFQKTCNSDLGVTGKGIRAEDCRRLVTTKYKILDANKYQPGEKCFDVDIGNGVSKMYQLGNQVEGNLYSLIFVGGQGPAQIELSNAIKLTETQFIIPDTRTCNEVCGIAPQEPVSTIKLGGASYIYQKGKIVTAPQQPAQQDKDKTVFGGCVTVNECREWRTLAGPGKEGLVLPDGQVLKGYTVESKGYTQGCFYDPPKYGIETISNNPDQRRECCCVKGKLADIQTDYYKPSDIDQKLEDQLKKMQANGKPVPAQRQANIHESKSSPGSAPKASENDPEALGNMKWSYRYWRIGYLTKKYNPNRYIEGRDKPACFGQDSFFYKRFSKEDKVLTLDPFKQTTSTLQCAYLTGINQRLQMYKNIMAAMSSCLIEIRQNGRADAGVCKELFTQHVCSVIWQAIRFFIDGCTPEDTSPDIDAQEEGITEKLKLGFKGIAKGISESQQELSQEYGNAKLNNLLGVGEGGVARKICLAAFGYDWDFTARNLVDAAYAAPFATLVQPVTASREFLTVEPQTLRPKYEYRASWLINPGCDLDSYRIDLACVTRREMDKYPNAIKCGSVGAPSIGGVGTYGTSTAYNQCDCLELTQENGPTRNIVSEGRITQNKLIERDFHRVIEDQYRYDHLKFTLRADRRIPANIRNNCFPSGYEEGVFYYPLNDRTARDIADCTVDPLSGVFSCQGGAAFFASRGIAQILEVNINGDNPERLRTGQLASQLGYQAGTPLRIGVRVTKTGKTKCIRYAISPDPITPKFLPIELEGPHDLTPVELGELTLAGTRGNVNAPGIQYELVSQQNQNIVFIGTQFIDNTQNIPDTVSKNVYSADDTAIIDGIEFVIRPLNVKVKPSNAEVPENTNTITVKKDNNAYETIKVEDGANGVTPVITIDKEGVVVKINSVDYTQSTPGAPFRSLPGGITIYPRQQETSSQQEKTISVTIYNLKEDRETFNGAEDCNLNDKIAEKTYKITVSQKGAGAAVAPLIQNLVTKRTYNIGEPVKISARITHTTPIKDYKIQIKEPNKPEETIIPKAAITQTGDIYEYIFDTAGKSPGTYFVNWNAESSVDSPRNQANQGFTFELKSSS